MFDMTSINYLKMIAAIANSGGGVCSFTSKKNKGYLEKQIKKTLLFYDFSLEEEEENFYTAAILGSEYPILLNHQIWIRIGLSYFPLQDHEAFRRLSYSGLLPWDTRKIESVKKEDLSYPPLEDYRLCNADVLLFHPLPHMIIPGIHTIICRGRKKLIQIGPLIDQAVKSIDIISKTAEHIPQIVLKEVLCNALIHNDWTAGKPVRVEIKKDTVRIINGLSSENLDLQNGYIRKNNPSIMRGFIRHDLATGFGTGIPKIQRYLPETTIAIENGNLVATIFR